MFYEDVIRICLYCLHGGHVSIFEERICHGTENEIKSLHINSAARFKQALTVYLTDHCQPTKWRGMEISALNQINISAA